MLRIALFAPHYAEYATRMALGLADRHRVLLVLDAKNRRNELEPPLLEAAKRKTDLFEFRSDTRIWRRLSRASVALRILMFRPHIVHVQEQPDQLTSAVVGVLRRFHPIVLTVHDPKPHTGRDAAYAMRWDKFRQRLRRAAAAYHVHGRYCAELMGSAAAPDRPIIEALHAVIMVPAREQIAEPRSDRILFFGRMEEYKGLDVLLAAARELNGRRRKFELVLAGRGPELDRLDAELRSLGNVVILNRYLTPAEAIAEFQKAAAIVIPYREATQSGVVAAAFANGRPVVASRVGGLVDVVENEINGLFVPPNSPQDLADALERILGDAALRDRLSDGARRSATAKLDWASVCRTLEDCYRSVLARAGGQSRLVFDRPARIESPTGGSTRDWS